MSTRFHRHSVMYGVSLGVNFLESFLLGEFFQFSFLNVFEVKDEQHKRLKNISKKMES